MLPLTPEKVRAVSACFKEGRYSTFPNYASRIKDHHVEAGFAWSPALDRAMARASRSVLRGIGPSIGAMALPLFSIAALAYTGDPMDNKLPVNIVALTIIASLFMLREVEASLLKVKHVFLDAGRKTVRLYLASSKTDPTARGCFREWGCLCGEAGARVCPFHAAWDHVQDLKRRFGQHLAGDMPFFPTASGAVPSKENVVRALRIIADLLALPRPSANRDYTGHSFRVTGAQFLAALGIDLAMIQLLARWASDVILRYVREAPLISMTRITRQNLEATLSRHDAAPPADLKQVAGIHKLLRAFEKRVASLEAGASSFTPLAQTDFTTHEDVIDAVDVSPVPAARVYEVFNPLSDIVHICAVGPKSGATADLHKTRCGWRFGSADHVLARAVEDGRRRCKRCWRRLILTDAPSSESDMA